MRLVLALADGIDGNENGAWGGKTDPHYHQNSTSQLHRPNNSSEVEASIFPHTSLLPKVFAITRFCLMRASWPASCHLTSTSLNCIHQNAYLYSLSLSACKVSTLSNTLDELRNPHMNHPLCWSVSAGSFSHNKCNNNNHRRGSMPLAHYMDVHEIFFLLTPH